MKNNSATTSFISYPRLIPCFSSLDSWGQWLTMDQSVVHLSNSMLERLSLCLSGGKYRKTDQQVAETKYWCCFANLKHWNLLWHETRYIKGTWFTLSVNKNAFNVEFQIIQQKLQPKMTVILRYDKATMWILNDHLEVQRKTYDSQKTNIRMQTKIHKLKDRG